MRFPAPRGSSLKNHESPAYLIKGLKGQGNLSVSNNERIWGGSNFMILRLFGIKSLANLLNIAEYEMKNYTL